jgi:hypothetical protein
MFRRNSAFYLLLIFTQIFDLACHNSDRVTVEKSDSIPKKEADTSIKVVIKESTDQNKLMKEVDSLIGDISQHQFLVNKKGFSKNMFTDTLSTTLYYKDSVPVRLQYTTFEDGGQPFGTADFYFNDFILFAHVMVFNEQNIFEVLTKEHEYLKFSKSVKSGIYKIINTPTEAKDYLSSSLIRKLYDLMQLYPDFKFHIPQIEFKGDLHLKIITTSPLYERADTNSTHISLLLKGESVGFIHAYDKRINFRGKEWIWYYIKYKDTFGWIVGHPDFVQELNDENPEE